jgi:transposase
MTLCCSRHGYEEAVWDQKLETFLRLHERAFFELEGVPTIVRHDNLKSGVTRACLYDPDINATYLAFAEHWGFTPLPTRPRNPQENGKQERSGGYVKTTLSRVDGSTSNGGSTPHRLPLSTGAWTQDRLFVKRPRRLAEHQGPDQNGVNDIVVRIVSRVPARFRQTVSSRSRTRSRL